LDIKIASTKDIPIGTMKGFENQGKKILVANVEGKFYAIGNICMHEGCTLSDGTLTGEKIECPCHGSIYDIRTGAVLKGPAKRPEPSFNLRVDNDQILLVT
jgi:nitrite reductase/ring-hydroxylating ferredoxin subunit